MLNQAKRSDPAKTMMVEMKSQQREPLLSHDTHLLYDLFFDFFFTKLTYLISSGVYGLVVIIFSQLKHIFLFSHDLIAYHTSACTF